MNVFRMLEKLMLRLDGYFAAHPHAITVAATVVATVLARFAVHASANEIALVASAVVAVIGALAHGSVKAAHADSAEKKAVEPPGPSA